jgi:DNA-binding MarR family transcriptional regulator
MVRSYKPRVAESKCTATAMRKASRRLSQLYDDALEPSGLRSTQFAVLSELDRRAGAPPTMGELANALVIERSALGHNLRPLERDKFVALEESPEDRRRRHVVLTPLGQKKLIEARRLWEKAQQRFDHTYGTEAASDLRDTLLRIAYDEKLAPLRE